MTPMKIPLKDYQVFAKNFMIRTPYCGLFLRMGTGKTSIVLEALWEINPSEHVLVIAPKAVARCTWLDEIRKWKMGIRTQSLVVNKKGKQLTKKQRDKIYQAIPTDPPTVYVINQEMVVNLVKAFPDNKWPFRIVIIDESQGFKSHQAERFKAMKKVRPWVSRLVLLSGSPTPKGLDDLWSQMWLLDMGMRLEETVTKFRQMYFNPGLIVNNYPVTWVPKYGAENEIYRRIGDLVISMKNTHLNLPPLIFNPVKVSLDPDEKAIYKEFLKTSVLELGDYEIEAANAAVLSAKLSQMASGAIYTNPKKHEYHIIHKRKLEMCKYIIDNSNDNVLIAYHFQSDADMLMNYFAEEGYQAVIFDGSPEMKDAWNNKQYPIMLLQPASNGRGLNLQEGGSTLIWYTLPWSLEEYDQTNARLHRQGQLNTVIIHQLMAEGTIDIRILAALNKKDLSQQQLIDAIEATINDPMDPEEEEHIA